MIRVAGMIKVDAYLFDKKQENAFYKNLHSLIKHDTLNVKIIGKQLQANNCCQIAIWGDIPRHDDNTSENLKAWFWGACRRLIVGSAVLSIEEEYKGLCVINEKSVMVEWTYLQYLTSIRG